MLHRGLQMAERRSRITKGIVVVVDRDPRWCDRIAEALELEGYHVLTVQDWREGAELVRVRRPVAVVAGDPLSEDSAKGLREAVIRRLPAHAPLILCCPESIPERHPDQVRVDDSGVLRVHRSLGADRLGCLVNQAVERRQR